MTKSKFGVALAVGTALLLGNGPASAAGPVTVAKCDSGKTKCVGGLAAGELICHSNAEKKGTAVDTICLNKSRDKFTLPVKGCIEKLEAKPPCSASGATTLKTDTETFVADIVDDVDPGAVALDPCGSGKKKCVSKLAKSLFGCEGKNITTPDAAALAACQAKANAKFTTPVTGCIEKLEASTKFTCQVNGQGAALLTKTQAYVANMLAEIAPVAPSSVDFTIGAGGGNCGMIAPGPLPAGHLINGDNTHLTCGGLAIGGSGSTVAEGATPSGNSTRFGLTGCSGGSCTLTGVADAGLPTGINGSKVGSFFGSVLPIPNTATPGLSTCVRNLFASDASGTVNLNTGDVSAGVNLSVTTWVTGNVTQPCPKCTGYVGTPGPASPKTGTCDRGATIGGACTTVNPNGLTKDCLPGGADGSFALAPFGVNLTPLVSATSSKTNATGAFCPSQAGNGCFGGSGAVCTSITENGVPAGALAVSTPAPVTLASVFCIPAAGNALIDGAASLPGPGATSLPGTLTTNP